MQSTTKEIQMTKINPLWTAYNNLHNEGGEGYNPHEKFIGADSGEPLWSRLMDRRDRVERIIVGTSTSDPRYKELDAELATLNAAIKIEMGK